MKMNKRFGLKVASVGLSALMLAGCSSAPSTSGSSGSGGESSDGDGYKIGVIEVQLNDESTNRATWFNDYIAPKYNCEFMFSETCSDLDSCMTFIENAAMAGCDAIINYYAVGSDTEALVQLCAEYGMVYTENGGRNTANEAVFTSNYENFAGNFQADQPATGKLFYDYLEESLDTSVEHGFIVLTGNAYQGNAQQTEISSNMLSALQDLYGLTYESTIAELVASSAPIEAANDKGIEIYCYPGAYSTSGWLEGFSAALQTGKYDYSLQAYNCLSNTATAIEEVESALNKDITVIGFGSFGEALTTAMNSTDMFGNQSVSMSTVKFTSLVSAMAFSKVYNCLTGNRDACLDENGEPSVLLFQMEAVTSPEQLAEMSSWDTTDKWVADYDFVDSLLADRTEGLTSAQAQENIYAMNYDAIKARLG